MRADHGQSNTWWRAMQAELGKMYCLLNPDLAVFSFGDKAGRMAVVVNHIQFHHLLCMTIKANFDQK
jgi:hypothetical protein